MTRQTACAWAAILTLLSACATHWDVDSFDAPEGHIEARKTFFWKGGDFGTPASIDPTLVASATAQVRNAVVSELSRKGYAETGSATAADMVVSFQVAGSQKFVLSDDRRIGAPSATTVLSPSEMQPPPASSVPREMRVRDGSVLVFIDDPATGRLIWRGMVSAETRSGSAEQGVRTITEMAREITSQVPAQAGTAK